MSSWVGGGYIRVCVWVCVCDQVIYKNSSNLKEWEARDSKKIFAGDISEDYYAKYTKYS